MRCCTPCASDSPVKQPAERKKPTLRIPEFSDVRRVLLLFPLLPCGRGSGAPIGAPSISAHLAIGERCAPCEGALANRRSAAVLYSRRAVLPDRTGALPASLIQAECYVHPSVRPVQRACLATQLPRGSRRTSRRASQPRAYEARPTGHRSRLRLHERLMKRPSASPDAAYVTHVTSNVKRYVTRKVSEREASQALLSVRPRGSGDPG